MRFYNIDWSEGLPPIFNYNGLQFNCILNSKGRIDKYKAIDHLGLCHILKPGEYQIRNSLHKAYSKLNGKEGNHDYFGYRELYLILKHLSKLYQFDLDKAFIRKIEIGVNIQLDNPAMNYLKKLKSVQFTKEAENTRSSRSSSKIYGKKITLSEYIIKFYDKTYDVYTGNGRVKLPHQILRYELVFNKTRTIKKHASTLADLLIDESYIALTELLYRKFTELQFNGSYDLSRLKINQLEQYYAGRTPKYWLELVSRNTNTSSTKRSRYKKIMRVLELDQNKGDPLLLELRTKLKKSIHDLV